MTRLQRYQSHTWNIFPSGVSWQEARPLPLFTVVLGGFGCFVRWFSFSFTMWFSHGVPWRKIIIPLVTFSPVCVPLSWLVLSFPSPFVVFVLVEQLHGSQRRVKILITLHTTRAGHKESVSRLNLMWSRRFTRNSRYLVFELRGLSFLQIGSCHSIFGNV